MITITCLFRVVNPIIVRISMPAIVLVVDVFASTILEQILFAIVQPLCYLNVIVVLLGERNLPIELLPALYGETA